MVFFDRASPHWCRPEGVARLAYNIDIDETQPGNPSAGFLLHYWKSFINSDSIAFVQARKVVLDLAGIIWDRSTGIFHFYPLFVLGLKNRLGFKATKKQGRLAIFAS